MPKETVSQVAERLTRQLGVPITIHQARYWKAKGYPIHDPEELRHRLLNSERPPKGLRRVPEELERSGARSQESPPSELNQADVERELATLQSKLIDANNYEEARTLRIQIAGIRDVLKELREQGRYILREDATKAAATAALASRGQWEKIEDSLPPMLEGLTALQMKEKLRDYARAVSLELASVFD